MRRSMGGKIDGRRQGRGITCQTMPEREFGCGDTFRPDWPHIEAHPQRYLLPTAGTYVASRKTQRLASLQFPFTW